MFAGLASYLYNKKTSRLLQLNNIQRQLCTFTASNQRQQAKVFLLFTVVVTIIVVK